MGNERKDGGPFFRLDAEQGAVPCTEEEWLRAVQWGAFDEPKLREQVGAFAVVTLFSGEGGRAWLTSLVAPDGMPADAFANAYSFSKAEENHALAVRALREALVIWDAAKLAAIMEQPP